ncbi:MAG: phage shock protein C [Bacteroidia bacterium]|jgi:phage shock protein C
MKKRVLETWKYIIEQRFFGVSAYVGEKLGMTDSRIRLYFIYLSFITFGSSILIYLFLAFWMEVRNRLGRNKPSVWDM